MAVTLVPPTTEDEGRGRERLRKTLNTYQTLVWGFVPQSGRPEGADASIVAGRAIMPPWPFIHPSQPLRLGFYPGWALVSGLGAQIFSQRATRYSRQSSRPSWFCDHPNMRRNLHNSV